jgi:predicted transcriptional regulator
MDLAYEHGSITSGELERLLPGGPSNSAIRVFLRSLETKGYLVHSGDASRFVYRPAKPREAMAKGELARLLSSFFGGSVTSAVATLLDQERERLTPQDIAELRGIIDRAAEEDK